MKAKYTYPQINYMYVDIEKPLGPQMVHLRKDKGISAREVAERMDVHMSNLYHWEYGEATHLGNVSGATGYAAAFNIKELRIKISNRPNE